ncbi:uncharacterized protein LOC126965383 [Leptidea sinapis]|uniref:uncharacterized protein LOC126965383 n=1 Tax=Leptidea sinapis TaxID=189913 RepID=UPI0021467451|nr:uncharacterized protein LOC126965383 [Leptidea sinapis]
MQVEEISNYEQGINKCCYDCKSDSKLSPEVQKAIRYIIQNEGYMKYQIETVALSPNGTNYLACLFEINITGHTKEGPKETNLFIKHTIPKENTHGMFEIDDVYMKEVNFYTNLNRLYEKLQEDANVPCHRRFRTVKCYDESNTDAIIMENLTKKGYTVLNRMETMSLEYARLAIQEIAKFHALSFAIQKKMPGYFEKNIVNQKYIITFNDKWKQWANQTIDCSLKYIDEDLRSKIKEMYPILYEKFSKYTSSYMSSVNCLCHGDYRPNNMMAKENKGEIEHVVPIDYQCITYASPVTDLLYLFYISTDCEFRERYEQELIDLYHDTMREFLSYFDIDSETVCPRKVFEADYETMRDYGLIIALIMLPFCFIAEDNIVADQLEGELKIDERFRGRISGIVNEFVKLGRL